jgi:hypothetical protein
MSMTAITVLPLGQVPSNYMYLLSKQGKEVSTGIRLEKADGAMEHSVEPSQLQGRIEKLEEENGFLKEKVAKLTSQLQHISTTVGVLMAGHNGHTTMLESLWLGFNDLNGQRVNSAKGSKQAENDDASIMEPIPIPPPSTPLSKANPHVYPSSSIRCSPTPPWNQPVKDPNVFWNAGPSPNSTIPDNFMNHSDYDRHDNDITRSPSFSNRAHSPRFIMDDEGRGPENLFQD